MAVPGSITIPLRLPRGEAVALAWLSLSINSETCDNFATAAVAYGRSTERDIIWPGVNFLRTTAAKAGLAA
jgi:hypothetical protein